MEKPHHAHLLALPEETVPIGVHAQLQSRMLQEILSPLNRMDARNQSNVGLSCHLEELLVIPIRMQRLE